MSLDVSSDISKKAKRTSRVTSGKISNAGKIHHMPPITAAVVAALNLATIHHMPPMITVAVVTAAKLVVCP